MCREGQWNSRLCEAVGSSPCRGECWWDRALDWATAEVGKERVLRRTVSAQTYDDCSKHGLLRLNLGVRLRPARDIEGAAVGIATRTENTGPRHIQTLTRPQNGCESTLWLAL